MVASHLAVNQVRKIKRPASEPGIEAMMGR
jgi:hypothetical protein